MRRSKSGMSLRAMFGSGERGRRVPGAGAAAVLVLCGISLGLAIELTTVLSCDPISEHHVQAAEAEGHGPVAEGG